MQPHLQRIEVESAAGGDDDLAVEHAPRRELGQGGLLDLGEVAIERTARDSGCRPRLHRETRSRGTPSHLGSAGPLPFGERARDLREHRIHRRSMGNVPGSGLCLRLRHDPQVRPRCLPALGYFVLRLIVGYRSGDDDVFALLPLRGRRDLVFRGQLERVDDAQDFVEVAPVVIG